MQWSIGRFASGAYSTVAAFFQGAPPKEDARDMNGDLPPDSGDGLWLGKTTETNKKAVLPVGDLAGHVLVAGDSGTENALAASVIAESALEKGVPVFVFDPRGRWTGFLKPCKDESFLGRYGEFGMLEQARNFRGRIIEAEEPALGIDPLAHAAPGEITVFAMDRLQAGAYPRAASCAVGWLLSRKPCRGALKLLLVFDEAHLLLGKDASVLRKACAELGSRGVGVLLVSQEAGELGGIVGTSVQLNTKVHSDVKRLCKRHGAQYGRRATMLAPGVAMLHNPRYNGGLPWCVALRPPMHSPHGMAPREREAYQRQGRLVEELERRIARIDGKDAADLALELRIVRNKLRSGRLKMAEMYSGFMQKRLGNTE